jgi:hypothetical protein
VPDSKTTSHTLACLPTCSTHADRLLAVQKKFSFLNTPQRGGAGAGGDKVDAVVTGAKIPRMGVYVCTDCRDYFDSALGAKRCDGCRDRRQRQRSEALARVESRTPPTSVAAGWRQLSEEQAAATKADLARAGLSW